MFGDFDDDIFDEERTTKTFAEPVVLLNREPEWFLNETVSPDEHEKWLALKFAADRLYRRREFEAAGHAYAKSIDACPNRNLGLLRDCVDGAARSYFKAGANFLAESLKYLESLNSMATCEDHKFSQASTAVLTTGDVNALQTLLESEPQACHLWKRLGENYVALGKPLYAVCCYLKAMNFARCCIHESKDRFKEENSALSREMESRVDETAAKLGDHLVTVRRIQEFFSSQAESKKEPSQSFEEFWFPAEDFVLKRNEVTSQE